MPSPGELASRMDALARGIAHWLAEELERQGRFPARSYYGEAFAAWLFLLDGVGVRDASVARATRAHREKDTTDPSYHWEFVNYAWASVRAAYPAADVPMAAGPLVFRGTEVVNWALLRLATRAIADGSCTVDAVEGILRPAQTRSGLIRDRPGSASFQYHAFSTALLYEIAELLQSRRLLVRANRAAEFSERFVLRSGRATYVGRGQEQIFGYGALLAALAGAYADTGDQRYLSAIGRIVNLLECHRRPDGSMPLVLRATELGWPASGETGDPHFPGWYGYNNLFDYAPFLGVFLRKASRRLGAARGLGAGRDSAAPSRRGSSPRGDFRDRTFHVWRTASYEAVVTRLSCSVLGRGGEWSSDLVFPLIAPTGGWLVSSSYGGEQFGRSLVAAECLPLPLFFRDGQWLSIRRLRLWSFLTATGVLILFPPNGLLWRRFRFGPTGVEITDTAISRLRLRGWYLFPEIERKAASVFGLPDRWSLSASEPMELQKNASWNWGGPLHALHVTPLNKLTIRIEPDV